MSCSAAGVRVIAADGDPVAADYAEWRERTGAGRRDDAAVVFLNAGSPPGEAIDQLPAAVARVCVISTHRVHFGDREAHDHERAVRDPLRRRGVTVTVFRVSPVVSPRSPAHRRLRRWGFLSPLVPGRLRGCCLDGDTLFAALERQHDGGRGGTYTLLGPNLSWRERLADHGNAVGAVRWLVTALTVLQVGRLAGMAYRFAARWSPRLRSLCFDTLRPASNRELLELYNRFSYPHVKVVGYNNGVVHFGQRHPGRTVVSTVGCNRVRRPHRDRLTCDGGATIRRAADVLARAGCEFYVVPNYSYVSVATPFFVPVHGNTSDVSTLGDTIERVLLFDPRADRVFTARRGEPEFDAAAYDLARPLVLLRATYRVRPRGRYFVRRETLAEATSGDVAGAFADAAASNVEVRKARAAGRSADVFRYYCGEAAGGDAVELPRDALGRLWDRLEEHRLARPLFHGLVRTFGHHVELFLTPEQFAVFWDTHAAAPVGKIQLRYIKRDGLPNSPFRDGDRISADLFMLKRHRPAFEAYLREHFRSVAYNPGKHSA
jgi:hypothetical protein